ncbi:ABC transporter ATP-binding protein [Silvanigrella aquatica]|uniref:ABC transporter domain-containing protein n=1 Tax=Silvanigrella aquatica TaxID=1915309 RepID=A0A1L4D4A0_9BACT|nr:ABC transporter ATP-binding protein [Silvanigrella aquatica]APJ04997.1 hypothetical protein AXG55_14290 [Silvanigrella aquatica]
MSSISLKAKHLAYALDSSKILFRNVCFEYKGGDIVCLLGHNGAGKSTLLKVCAGVLSPSNGNLVFYNNLLPYQNGISWLPQQLSRPENFNVTEFLNLQPMASLNIESGNLHILDDFGIHSLNEMELTELSGGEWKRVQLARIWSHKAKWLFLDEPESDLDWNYKEELIYNCKLYAQQNNAIIFMTTHDLYFAKKVANKICALSDGIWVWDSSADVFWNSKIIHKLYGVGIFHEL